MISTQVAYFADLGSKLILVLLFAASFFVVAFYVERKLFFKKHFNPEISPLVKRLNSSNGRAEIETVLKSDKFTESEMVLTALKNSKVDSSDKLLSNVSTQIDLEKKNWEKFLLYFATVGSNAPFLGLLGTVLGLMQSFSDLALAARPDAKAAMSGISNALITTVAGIVIAIPSVVIYNSLSKKVKTISTNIKAVARTVADTIF
jgi:biopolymer transport protein ExbB/TolQ